MRDRERLEQHEIAVDDHRQPAVRIDREEFRRARAGVADLDRQVLVVDAELLRHPERAKGAGAGDAVDLQTRYAFLGSVISGGAYSTIAAPSQ